MLTLSMSKSVGVDEGSEKSALKVCQSTGSMPITQKVNVLIESIEDDNDTKIYVKENWALGLSFLECMQRIITEFFTKVYAKVDLRVLKSRLEINVKENMRGLIGKNKL